MELKMPLKVLQFWAGGEIPEDNLKCIQSVNEVYLSAKLLKPKINFENIVELVSQIDKLKFAYAAKYKNVLIIDTDITITEPFVFEGKRPYLNDYKGMPDCGIIYNNGNRELFKWVLDQKERRGIGDFYGWPRKILRRLHWWQYNIIDNTKYHHIMKTYSEVYNNKLYCKKANNKQLS